MTRTGLHVPPTYKYLRQFLHVNVYTDGKISAAFVDPDDGCLPTLSILAEPLDVIQQHLAQPHPDRAAQTEVCDCFLSRINIRYRQEARNRKSRPKGFPRPAIFSVLPAKRSRAASFRSWVAVDDGTNNVGRVWLESCPTDGAQYECPSCEQEL
jgi:hypothetical protein